MTGGVALASPESSADPDIDIDIDAGADINGGATTADIGFCTDMSTHHVQVLAMCQRVQGRDTGDPVQAAASEVLQTQSIEIGTMRVWLADWGQ